MSTAAAGGLEALAYDIGAAVGALTGRQVDVQPGPPAAEGRSWLATFTAEGDDASPCLVRFDHAGAAALAALVSSGTDPEDVAVANALGEVLVRAAGTMGGRETEERLELTLVSLEPQADRAGMPEGARWLALAVAGVDQPMALALGWQAPAEAAEPAAADTPTAPGAAQGSRLDVILDIDLPVVVRFGHTKMPIRALSRLGPGSIIELGRSPDDPVEVLVSNRVVARGEVVIVSGSYGVRILDVTSQSERARSLEE